ncbi:MAG: Crp/Fnr family transcriptional regulator [Verrucomicrobiota bacterium]
MEPIAILRSDISRLNIDIPAKEWAQFEHQLEERFYPKKSIIFSQVSICSEVLFIAGGITASGFVTEDGNPMINRFFQKNNLCSNIVSAVTNSMASDNVFAITTTSAVSIPYELFYECYLRSGKFGEYLRIKLLHTLLEDKDFLSIKTISDTTVKYRFLADKYREILALVPQKDIANFLGLTPEGFSRFLRKYHCNS